MSDYRTREKNKSVENNHLYREIITKAVCGTARKIIHFEKIVFLPKGKKSEKILGTRVTKFNLNPVDTGPLSHQPPKIRISGAFEINVWYSFNDGRSTDVVRELLDFEETLDISDFDPHTTQEAGARIMITRFPDCKQVRLNDDHSLMVDIELGIYVEVIGKTKLFVHTSDHEEDDS